MFNIAGRLAPAQEPNDDGYHPTMALNTYTKGWLDPWLLALQSPQFNSA